MKVTFITTVGHNVGDDFVRDGICHLLREAWGPFEVQFVHKHFPASARAALVRWHLSPAGRWLLRRPGLRKPGRLSRWMDWLPLNPRRDAVLGCDVLVQSGAPVYWLNRSSACEDNEWYDPLIRRRWKRTRAVLMNLGAGACQEFASEGSEFAAAPATLAFVREFYDACAVTTVRDRLSERVLALAGRKAERLPCPSIFARQWHAVEPGPGDYVALNFMALGGHYDLDGSVDAARWRMVFGAVLATLRRSERCVLACHDRDEERLARRWFPETERFIGAAAVDYLRFYAHARSGILNRVHGAFALASMGRPAVIVGADSRARMGEELELPVLPAAGSTAAEIVAAHSAARDAGAAWAARMRGIASTAERRYVELLRDAFPRA
jgi:hypothetical protein